MGGTVFDFCLTTCLQEHGHTAREDVLRDQRNHGPLGGAAQRLKVMHADFEDFASIK